MPFQQFARTNVKARVSMIRKATLNDIEPILSLLIPRQAAGTVLPRTREEIESNLRDFFVYEIDGKVLGTCSLVHGAQQMVEVRSLVVDSRYGRKGIGTALVQACIDDALDLGYQKIFALTYVVPVFQKLGFHVIDKNRLPDKIWRDCQSCHKQDNCDETAVIRDLITVEVNELPNVLNNPDTDPAVSI